MGITSMQVSPVSAIMESELFNALKCKVFLSLHVPQGMTFISKFKAPQEFIRFLKLERAAELLKQKTPVAEVAVMTGFANSKYFSTVFKKHFGVSPSRFGETD
ncbi:AraC family transcriptional regulator [uncultured Duncaniella sp.]|uniref:helix-turn-helix domain-containing protein n=1 Tax=uncultured Duncaniella sp. TaxID=2768039 RepID=UPI002674A661|nr:helix-turn-helix transcriptional regulator [uncultured Duncaniella sp.]